MLHVYYVASGMSLEDAKAKVKQARQMSQFFMLSDAQQAFLENLAQNADRLDSQSNEQQPIQSAGIDHVYLLVSNLEKARGYYQAIFGLTVALHPTAQKTVMCESPELHFFIEQVDFPKPFLSKQHLSLRVSDVQTIRDTLQSLDIPYRSGTFTKFEYQNYHWVEWRDPDGIRLECVELI